MGAFLRIMVSFNIGLGNRVRIKNSIKTILFYQLVVSLVFSVLLFFGARPLGKLLLNTDEELDAFQTSMIIFSLHLPADMLLPSMSTIFRYDEHYFRVNYLGSNLYVVYVCIATLIKIWTESFAFIFIDEHDSEIY